MTGLESHRVRLRDSRGVREVRLDVTTQPPWAVTLHDGDQEFRAEESDLFECLTTIRRELETRETVLCCAGARRDVYPSGMARDMGGGRRAYLHRDGVVPSMADLVDIFDSVPCDLVVTVAEQEAAVRSRRRG